MKMNKLMLKTLLLLLSSILLVYCQQRFPVVPISEIKEVWIEEEIFQKTKTITKYSIKEKITIKDKEYSKLFKDQMIFHSSDTISISKQFGYLRNSNKISYFLPLDSSEEFILYNYNLSVGDKFYIYGDSLQLNHVDSIFFDKKYRVRQVFTSKYDNNIIAVEGIGSNSGLFLNYFRGLGSRSELKCYKKGDVEFCFTSICKCDDFPINKKE